MRQDDPRGNWHIGSDLVGPARRREGHVTAGPADPAIQRPVIERIAGPDDDPAHRRPVIRTAHAQPGNSSAHVRGAGPRDQPSPCAPTVRWVRVKNVSSPEIFFSLTADGRGGQASPGLGAHTLELAERPPVNQQSALHLGKGRPHLVILLLRERCGQVLPEPVEVLADDPADLLIARGPMPRVRRRSAGRGRHARQRRHAECLVLVCEQPGPGSQIGEELVEHRVEGVRLGNPSVSLLHVQNRVDDLAEHLVEGGRRIVAPGRAHAGTDAGRRPPPAQGRAIGLGHRTRGTSLPLTSGSSRPAARMTSAQ